MENYTRLSMAERCLISTFLSMDASIDRIAKRSGRHRSTIYREIKRNQEKGSNRYMPGKADAMSKQRHPHPPNKLDTNKHLIEYIIDGLKKGWSPEQISGRMKKEKKEFYICPESIYRYIYRHKELGLYQWLPQKKSKRHSYLHRKNKKKSVQINKRNISLRAPQVNERQQIGHWEGDTIHFPKHQKMCVTTLVERKSRYICLHKNNNKKSATIIDPICKIIQSMPKKLWATLTLDQGREFMDFRSLERLTRCKIYFCDPHSPWQRGSNENMNGRLRRYLPKKFCIDSFSQEALDQIAFRVNNTPRKCLGYLTPMEVMKEHWKAFCRTGL